jgi:hypothetical protein
LTRSLRALLGFHRSRWFGLASALGITFGAASWASVSGSSRGAAPIVRAPALRRDDTSSERRKSEAAASETRAHEAGASEVDESLRCRDPLAMAANDNLVTQVHDYGERWRHADEAARRAERRLRDREGEVPARLATSREEWTRMARDGIFRLRLPCQNWNDAPRTGFLTASGGRTSASRSDAPVRAVGAGISSEELEGLREAYARAAAKTWAKMKAVCVRDEDYQAAEADEESPLENDYDRIQACRASLVHRTDGRMEGMAHVAKLHAAGVSTSHAQSEEELVLLALDESSAELFTAMVHALGREKALRAVDYGVLCLEESFYVLGPGRTPA